MDKEFSELSLNFSLSEAIAGCVASGGGGGGSGGECSLCVMLLRNVSFRGFALLPVFTSKDPWN